MGQGMGWHSSQTSSLPLQFPHERMEVMFVQIGSRYEGSPEIETSVAGEEILPENKAYYKFGLMVDEDCTVSINGSNPIFLRAGLGFTMNEIDGRISSVKIQEDGIPFNWIGGY